MPRLRSVLLSAAGVLFAFSTFASAQDYPTKPVRIVVPFPPGAINDLAGRTIAAELSERMGKQFIVENRPGAGAVVGSELVAKAPNDGYTLLIVSLSSAVNPWLHKLSYEPVKAFTPISPIVTAPNVVAVNPSVEAKSIKELIALAKKKPGELQYASAGIGSFLHLGGELFKGMAGVDMLHVPFKGAAPALTDVIGGHTQVVFGTATSSMPHVRSGKLRALGVGSMQRTKTLADIPTVIEAGLPGYHAANWVGLVAPAGTPAAIVERLHKEIAAIQKTPKVQEMFAKAGAEMMEMSIAEFGEFQTNELQKWGKVVKDAGIKAQ